MKFFDPKKHIWSGIFGSFKDCEKKVKNAIIFLKPRTGFKDKMN